MLVIADQQQRQSALDVSKSFIVQAPAGSGKTSLLIQRYLALLAYCDLPEEILAITFTRKAAREMHSRIFSALTAAANTSIPEDEHKAQVWYLAKNVIERSHKLGWGLLENPKRLRLQTIDSLCGSLAKQLPILSGLGLNFEILTETMQHDCYALAARNLLSTLEDKSTEYFSALSNLLDYLDNDFNRAEKLLAEMLETRDQWLPHIINDLSQKDMEKSLANIVTESLAECKKHIPSGLQQELIALTKFANPQDFICELDLWKAATNLLIKKDSCWRQTINKNQGFPADNKEMKQRWEKLLEGLNANEVLRKNLYALMIAPPLTYSSEQWKIVLQLLVLLKHLAANLKVLLQEKNSADYTEVSLAALQALGDEENTTDLALKLDYKIKHILVDEFQDTSVIQYRLLEKLTAGWQPNDGRTLFLVGDPMQSIYKFREAKVGLFIRAKRYGINSIKLQPLTLTTNFRSKQHLITWVNEVFTKVMPQEDNIGSGAVKFVPANAIRPSANDNMVSLITFEEKNHQAEAQCIIDIIQAKHNSDPQETIAILVRSRANLAAIIPALRSAKISYQAVDLEKLQTNLLIRDLLSLTKALLNPADRVSWLAILRAPWCGLSLADLYAVAGEDHLVPLWSKLITYNLIPNLSADGKRRLAHLVEVLKPHIINRRRQSLAPMIEDIWLALNGSDCLFEPEDSANAKLYFELLAKHDTAGTLTNMELFQKHLEKLSVPTETEASNKLQIMTIHRAKGLEFDTVIIPGLEQKSAHDDAKLLSWLERPSSQSDKESDLIFAPIKRGALDDNNNSIYQYLRHENQQKNHYETGRLLYVAVTRAKNDLYLLSSAPAKAPKGSLLEQISFCFHDKATDSKPKKTMANKEPETLSRIASKFFAN